MIGTATCQGATRVLLLGSGELGKEIAIECQRLGIEVIACDSYANAPAMHVAHRSHVLNMLNGDELAAVIAAEKPDFVVPEIEAVATATLLELEQTGLHVVPCASATQLTMNREGIRRLAADELQIATSPFAFADTKTQFLAGIQSVGMPCVVKPVMSSSGKGQSVITCDADIEQAWVYSQEGGRSGRGRVIIEGFVDFDYEITLLTVQAIDGIHFCDPIGHRQQDGDYRESWQPQIMTEKARVAAEEVAKKIVTSLGGFGVFGVELFIKGDNVLFNEVSPRPHDTGMVTLISQDLSEFALHVRAFLGLPIGTITSCGPSASAVILGNGTSTNVRFNGLAQALCYPQTQIRLFGKPQIDGHRRLGVVLCRDDNTHLATQKAINVASSIEITY